MSALKCIARDPEVSRQEAGKLMLKALRILDSLPEHDVAAATLSAAIEQIGITPPTPHF